MIEVNNESGFEVGPRVRYRGEVVAGAVFADWAQVRSAAGLPWAPVVGGAAFGGAEDGVPGRER